MTQGTHDVQTRADVVIKTYRPGSQDAARREWRALTLLAAYAPGLAPAPIRSELSAEPASVTMSRLAGVPPAEPVGVRQVEAMAEAVRTMQEAVPREALLALPSRAGSPAEMLSRLRRAFAEPPPTDRLAGEAFRAAAGWIRDPELDAFAAEEAEPVLGTGDGNLANYLWDGRRIGIVDFEHAGRSDRPYELAEIVEHVSLAASGIIDAAHLLAHFDLTPAEAIRLRTSRRLLAAYWLLALLPSSPDRTRNPPQTLPRQATRLLTLLP
jgi:aminoglycoside phosphotransferase